MKGQAFETMMLVISVIVAVAILGILLGFLGGITPFGTNAETVVPDLVKKVAQRSYGLELEKSVEFSEGDRFYATEILEQLAITKLTFVCVNTAAVCGASESDPLVVEDNKITVNKKISATIAACTGNGNDYFVVIGDRGKDGVQDTSDEAESKCGLD